MTEKKKSFADRAMNAVERVGNNMLSPLSIFLVLCILTFIVSAIVTWGDVSVIHPKDGSTVKAVNLFGGKAFGEFCDTIVRNFQNFPPLGAVLVVMLGVGVAERTGLMATALRASLADLPKGLITVIVMLLGILGNAAGDSGFIVLPPLAAIVFISVGRHPFIGMFAAFAGVAGGFAANLIVNMSDVLVAGFTISSAQIVDPNYMATPAMNYYFIVASTFMLVGLGYLITEKVIAPRFEGVSFDNPDGEEHSHAVTDQERKGLRAAGISLIVFFALIVIGCLGEYPVLGDPKTGSVVAGSAPLMKWIIPIITIAFLIPGFVYGKVVGNIKSDKDVARMMGKSMAEMGPFIVIAFAAAQFMSLFTKSNLGIILAIKGAGALQSIGLTGMGLILGFIVLTTFINLFIGSASVKWAILAPIFVPMFMLLGVDPALTQMAYRIGDSVTNPICPVFAFFPIILGYMQRYDKNAGLGTIWANMLPYSFSFLICWSILLVIWVSLGLPLGPN